MDSLSFIKPSKSVSTMLSDKGIIREKDTLCL